MVVDDTGVILSEKNVIDVKYIDTAANFVDIMTKDADASTFIRLFHRLLGELEEI